MAPDDGPRVLVSDRQDLPIDLPPLLEAARATLTGEGAGDAELSLSFVDPAEMRSLHLRYMDEEGPTDVLSFSIDERGPDGVRVLGDVVVCPAVAKEAANAYEDELRLLVVHGTLHLLGHDHDAEDDRAEMWARQERYSGVRA